ncbi:MAG: hypothetical protein CMJ68_05385 [Planctomycetaceae bacterium]|nr:hypothetical protein [Planctomycetaceae bacterium]
MDLRWTRQLVATCLFAAINLSLGITNISWADDVVTPVDGVETAVVGASESTTAPEEFRLVSESNPLFADEPNDATTLGRRFWAAPRWERRTGNDGAFPLDGDLNGVSIGWRTRNAEALFLSFEGVIMGGGFDLTTGNKSDYDEWQIEGLLGYTYVNEDENLFLTPYLGFRYREAENFLPAPSNLDVIQEAWSLPLGVRADLLLTEDIAIGIDARMQIKTSDEQDVQGPGFSVLDSASTQLTYRIAAPFTIRLTNNTELELRPHYEWDRFDSGSGSRETRIDEYGGQVTFILRY